MNKKYDEFVEKVMGMIYVEYTNYINGVIDINRFLLRRFNIVFEEAYLNHRDDTDFNPYQFLTALHFDLFHEADVLHEIGYF